MAWEFERLFDAEAEDPEQPRLWSVLPSSIKVGSMGYRRRKTKAGPRLEVEIYPAFGREQMEQLRAAKTNETPEAMARYNHERARRRVVQLADANFDERDLSLTLTYNGTPPSYDQALRDVRNFLRKVKRRRAAQGLPELKYIYSVEGNEDGSRTRIHIHMLISGGLDRETLEELWARGYANADRLQPDGHGLEAIARYITKQQRNRKKWVCSRNLTKPKEDKRDCRMPNARVKNIAYDFRNGAKPIMEQLYPSYQFIQCEVRYSDIVDGVYIRCLMRRKPGRKAGK